MFNKEHAQKIDAAHNAIDNFAEVLELIKNPQPFYALHDSARRQMELTQETLRKHQEATKFVEDYEEKKAALEKQESDLKSDQELHQADVEEHRKTSKAENERLKNLADDLAAKARELESGLKELQERKAVLEQEYSEKMTPIDDMRAQAEKNVAETEMLKKEAEALVRKQKKKLKDITVAASSDDEENAA